MGYSLFDIFAKMGCSRSCLKFLELRLERELIDREALSLKSFCNTTVFADSSHPEVTHCDLELHPDGMSFKFGVWEVITRLGQPPAPMLFVTTQYHLCHPLIGYFQRRAQDDSLMSLFFMVTPVDEEECVFRFWLLENYLLNIPEQAFFARQDQIISQDIAVVESQRPRRLPLDLQAEVHWPSDRYSVAYRKWLKQQGVTFGSI